MRSAGTPVIFAATSGVMARTDSRTVANACVRRATNSLASSPLAITWLSIALNSATSVPGCIWRWTSARPASSVLRGSATMSVAPRSWARLIAAPKTGWDSVVFAPAMKMTSAACSTSRIEPDAPEVLRARRAPPDPMTALLDPAAADQGPREAVVMLREVVAESALHARGALIGGIELDVGRGDSHDLVARDVQVHLTPDAAVGTHRADGALRSANPLRREPLQRHDLENRAGGAHPDTLATPSAPSLVGIAVRAHDDFGVLTPLRHVQHADHLDVLARAHAACTQDAGAHVVPDHRVAGALVAVSQRQVPRAAWGGSDTVAHHVALELVAGRGPPAVPQVVSGIALEQQPQHALAALDRGRGFRLHYHPVRHFGRAGRHQLRLPLDRDEADAAVADGGQLGIPAEGGDVHDPGGAGGVEDRLLGVGRDPAAVDCERSHDLKD